MLRRSLCSLLLVLSLIVDKHSRAYADDDNSNLDIVFLIDTSRSFEEDLPRFQAVVQNIVAGTEGLSPATRYGLAHFSDFDMPQFGVADVDTDYTRDLDLVDDASLFVNAAMALPLLDGNDEAESSLSAVDKAVSETDEDIRMNFRDDARKVIVLWTDANFQSPETTISSYPGPTFATVIENLGDSSVDPPYVFVGLNRDGVGRNTALGTPDLQRLATATNAVAEGSMPCGSGGGGTLATGEALVCTLVGGSDAAIQQGFINIITAGAGAEPVAVTSDANADCDTLGFLGQLICDPLVDFLPDFILSILLPILSILP